MKPNKKKLLLISSSGGHYEQLRMLSKLEKYYKITWVTESTKFDFEADYFLTQSGSKDKLLIIKLVINTLKSIYIWIKSKPDYVITTGAMVAIPMALMAKIFRKKLIYIETFARVYDSTKTGKFLYRYADLFIVQWEDLLKIYPNAIYGGSIY